MSTVSELLPDFRKLKMSDIKGSRSKHHITFNPNKVNPEEEIYIDIPKLNKEDCLVPKCLALKFDFKNANTKSWFLNNLGKGLMDKFTVSVGGEILFDNTGNSTYEIYKDLWLPERTWEEMCNFGIANENTRKIISKSDDGAKTGTDQKVSDALVASVLNTKQKIKLCKILGDHGLFSPSSLDNNFQYRITLPKAEKIMKAQSAESVEGYSLENIELEYEKIQNEDIAQESIMGYETGKSLSFEHVTPFKTEEWDKSYTLLNETINLPRKSMAAIVMLFRNKTVTDSEEYVFPNIESIKITIEGVPNSVYSQGIKNEDLYDEAKRLFEHKSELEFEPSSMTIRKFFKDKFALVVDLRTTKDKLVVGAGNKLLNTQNGVLLEITKKATTANVMCHIFVVSDGLVNFKNKTLENVHY